MPGLLSCVSDLLDPGAAEADTLKSQWPLHNLEGRKSPVSKLKPNTVEFFQNSVQPIKEILQRPQNWSQKAHKSAHTVRPRLRSPHLSA